MGIASLATYCIGVGSAGKLENIKSQKFLHKDYSRFGELRVEIIRQIQF